MNHWDYARADFFPEISPAIAHAGLVCHVFPAPPAAAGLACLFLPDHAYFPPPLEV